MENGQLTPELLLRAYAMGVFPMSESQDAPEIFWVDPRRRGVLPLDDFHISRSLARCLRRAEFRISIDEDFADTVRACADRAETWINTTIFDLYCELHRLGHAHSLEVRAGDDLVGGVYGVCLGGVYFGESMFSRRTNASKIALAYLVDHLARAGFVLFDTQFVTPHLRTLGAVEITRGEYHSRLASGIRKHADFLGPSLPQTPQELLQRRTQTS